MDKPNKNSRQSEFRLAGVLISIYLGHLYTLELDERKLTVRQNRGMRNCPRTPEVQAFEELWLSWVRAGAPRDSEGKPICTKAAQARTA